MPGSPPKKRKESGRENGRGVLEPTVQRLIWDYRIRRDGAEKRKMSAHLQEGEKDGSGPFSISGVSLRRGRSGWIYTGGRV